MKFKFIKLFFLACFFSSNVSAGIITYGSYSHDTDSNVVLGDGLEWLKWSITNNMSYSEAIIHANAKYGSGWEIATSAQIAGLIRNFDFGFTWDPLNPSESAGSAESAGAIANTNYQNASFYNFVSMFGHTYRGHEGNTYADWSRFGSRAIFGPIDPNTNKANLLSVWSLRNISNFNCCKFEDSAKITLSENYQSMWDYRYSVGIALTRTSTLPKPDITVPEPSALAIFALGIFGLASRRLKKH